jgi:shikimate dehydrogenase
VKKACVIGWPIAHSRSPLIHNYWIALHGLEGSYEKRAVEHQNVGAFFHGLRQGAFVGCNVTIPHKETAITFIDEVDDRVRRIGALNTVWEQDGKLHATSTDGPGFLANVKDHCPDFNCQNKSITVLGAGGSARALIDELLRQGVDRVAIHNRTHERAEVLAKHFGPRVTAIEASQLSGALTTTDLLINTTSQGMNSESEFVLPLHSLKHSAIVADIVYTPLVTPFLKSAEASHHKIVPGLGMLLHQAVIGFEKWFGILPTVTPELHALVARDIDPDDQP